MIAKSLVAVALLAAVATADTSRRPAPGKLSKAAGDEFARAVAAEKRGDLHTAIDHYKASLELVLHPNTVFNKAEVEARVGFVQDAIMSYAMYLSLAPNAPDRAAVAASIKKLVASKATLVISGNTSCASLATAYVFVDGVLVRKPGGKPGPISVPVGLGAHQVDAVTAVSFGTTHTETTSPGRRADSVCVPTRVDGNVVVQYTRGLAVASFKFDGERRALPPGEQQLAVSDRGYECPPVSVSVPKDDSVLYVHVSPVELVDETLVNQHTAPFRCRKLAVKTHTLTF